MQDSPKPSTKPTTNARLLSPRNCYHVTSDADDLSSESVLVRERNYFFVFDGDIFVRHLSSALALSRASLEEGHTPDPAMWLAFSLV